MLSDPAIEGEPLKFLALCEAYWTALRTQPPRRGPAVLKAHARRLGATPAFDVAVCGGTLGLLLATALQARGLAVCIIERRVVAGRAQECCCCCCCWRPRPPRRRLLWRPAAPGRLPTV